MDLLEICISLTIALFGIAFPMVITEIGSINSKYNSEIISSLLKNEFEWRAFNYNLYISLFLIAVYGFGKVLDYGLRFNHMLTWSIFLASIMLAFSFILLVKKIFYYKSDLELKSYLIKKNHKLKFEVLTDLLIYSIHKNPKVGDNDIRNYFSQYFYDKRKSVALQDVKFSSKEYDFIYRLHNVVLTYNVDDLVLLQYNISAGEWFLGDEYHGTISDEVYSVMWHNLNSSINNNKEYIVIKFWKNIYDYWYHIPSVLPEFDPNSEGYVRVNQHAIVKRKKERQDVIDFTTALGGALYINSKWHIINTIFFYKQSNTPDYRILPYNIKSVFELFFRFYDIGDLNFPLFGISYPFPNFVGDAKHDEPKIWVSRYIVLLYLRLFVIDYNYTSPNITPFSKAVFNEEEQIMFDLYYPYFYQLLLEIWDEKTIVGSVFGKRKFVKDPKVHLIELYGDPNSEN